MSLVHFWRQEPREPSPPANCELAGVARDVPGGGHHRIGGPLYNRSCLSYHDSRSSRRRDRDLHAECRAEVHSTHAVPLTMCEVEVGAGAASPVACLPLEARVRGTFGLGPLSAPTSTSPTRAVPRIRALTGDRLDAEVAPLPDPRAHHHRDSCRPRTMPATRINSGERKPAISLRFI